MADEGKEIAWEEIHFCPIPSQTNIYGLTKVEGREEGNKVFLASLSGGVICLEYQQNWLVPSAREVPFTYIPGSKEFSHCYLRQPRRNWNYYFFYVNTGHSALKQLVDLKIRPAGSLNSTSQPSTFGLPEK